MDKYLGKRLDGRYELKEIIGIGGMANVYRSYDIAQNKDVAVKILKEEFLDDDELVRSFRNESKAISALSHPNIVKIIDVNFGDRIQYIVMELIDGITLKEYIEQVKVLNWKDAVHFTVQILRALQHAHDNGIVHRDIKPQNIMLLPDGTIKVMDFGIARFSRDEKKRTQNRTIGSVHYISPEQVRGEEAGERSDIYSVGVMLYEMLTGKLPYDGDSAEKIAVMHLQGVHEPLRKANETIPEGLEEIAVRAMQKEPTMRYQSAAEMLRDIDEFKRNPSIVFEYKYFAGEGSTKYFDVVGANTSPVKTAGDEDEEWEDDGHKRGVSMRVLAGITVAFVIAAIIFALFLFFNPIKGETYKVPNLVGQKYTEVVEKYKQFNFTIGVQEYTDEYDKGVIFEQDVKPGSERKEDAKIAVKVSKGLKPADLPDVVGKDLETAKSLLEKAGFKVDVTRQFDSTVPVNQVIAMDPQGGENVKYPKKTKITLTYAIHKDPVVMEDLTGKTYSEAEAWLKGKGLNASRENVDNEAAAGTVIGQSVPGGKAAEEGQTITLRVSTGVKPQPVYSSVPISLKLPEYATGKYTFHIYLSGREIKKDSDVDLDSLGSVYSFTVPAAQSEEEAKTDAKLVVKVNEAGKSEEHIIAEYTVDRANGTATFTGDRTAAVFKRPSSSSSAPSSTPSSSPPASSSSPSNPETSTEQ